MIRYFNLEIMPEFHTCQDGWLSVRFRVKTHQDVYTFQQSVSIEELQTNSILDLMFKIAKEKLKELIDKETLDDK